MRIDPHVHCRDGKQAYKTTIAEVLEIAEHQGVDIIFDMPNTDPPIITESDVEERLALVPSSGKGRYFLYVGLTAGDRQITEAVDCWCRFREVIGLKMFAGRSNQSLSVVDDAKQKYVYKVLSLLKYEGVVAVHCEREADLKPKLWDPAQPVSHSMARPKYAEIKSVQNQINFAGEAGFEGTLHICHVSCPETVEIIRQGSERFNRQMKITCGVTPHHLMYSIEKQEKLYSFGNYWKVNPPLRSENDRLCLLRCLGAGDINWIETDHAPHSLSEKFMSPHLSGVHSLYLYNDLIKMLLDMKVSSDLIEAMTFGNIVKVLSPKLDHFVQ
jgi:dihydroorotase